MKKRSIAPLLFGLAFLAFGIIYLGNMLFNWNIDVFFDGWWTLFIIVPAFISSLAKGPRVFYIEVMVIGVLLLLWRQDVITSNYLWILLVASALILFGISLIISFFKPKKNVVIETQTYTCNNNGNQRQTTVNVGPAGVTIESDNAINVDDQNINNGGNTQ